MKYPDSRNSGINVNEQGQIRPYFVGCGARSDDPATFSALSSMFDEGVIDHIQVLLIPEPEHIFRSRLDFLSDSGVLVFIHAPYHQHGVNPCAPAAYDLLDAKEAERNIEHAMNQTFEAADALNTPYIVLHPGRYEAGGKKRAYQVFHEFYDQYYDRRLLLENLPAVYDQFHFIGATADELVALSGGKNTGYCLDFPHLYCTSNYLGHSYSEELEKFGQLRVCLHHLSNSEKGSIRDQHLPLDHPRGGLDFRTVFRQINLRPGIHTSLEYKDNDIRLYREQVEVFRRLFMAYSEKSE